jgi:hypothetical protein
VFGFELFISGRGVEDVTVFIGLYGRTKYIA